MFFFSSKFAYQKSLAPPTESMYEPIIYTRPFIDSITNEKKVFDENYREPDCDNLQSGRLKWSFFCKKKFNTVLIRPRSLLGF